MPYSKDFFALQLRFAQELASRFALPLEDVLLDYTTFPLSFGQEKEWQDYLAGLQQAEDPAQWTYEFYLPRSGGEPTSQDTTFHGHLLFGCFYFVVRDEHIIRPHLIKKASSSGGVLSSACRSQRREELAEMFRHIEATVPTADLVQGNSWLYNLEAYRRLFPPEYTENMPVSEAGEYRYLARWGQFFDKHWQLKETPARALLDRVANLDRLENLRHCFPYPIFQPRCSIEHFYAFYNTST